MCSIVLLLRMSMSFSFYFRSLPLLLTLPFLYNGIRWIGPCDVMFSKHSSTYNWSVFTIIVYVNIIVGIVTQR